MEIAQFDRSKTWTVEDYLQLEEGLLAQLIEGTLVMSPAPTLNHQRVVRRIYDMLRDVTTSGELVFSPIDLYIDDLTVLQPDLVFVADDQKEILVPKGIEGAPYLVIEVLSPSNSFIDRNTKKKLYLDFGVKEYWMVDPANRTLEAYTPDSLDTPHLYLIDSGSVTSSIFPDRSFEFANVFKYD